MAKGKIMNYPEGALLMAARKATDLSPHDAADLFGVPLMTYKRWENGTLYPPAATEWPIELWDGAMSLIGDDE